MVPLHREGGRELGLVMQSAVVSIKMDDIPGLAGLRYINLFSVSTSQREREREASIISYLTTLTFTALRGLHYYPPTS